MLLHHNRGIIETAMEPRLWKQDKANLWIAELFSQVTCNRTEVPADTFLNLTQRWMAKVTFKRMAATCL